jgi:hypothetical protein
MGYAAGREASISIVEIASCAAVPALKTHSSKTKVNRYFVPHFMGGQSPVKNASAQGRTATHFDFGFLHKPLFMVLAPGSARTRSYDKRI